MSISILIDMNLGRSWQSYLQERGFDAVHWSEIGQTLSDHAAALEAGALVVVDLIRLRVRLLPLAEQ